MRNKENAEKLIEQVQQDLKNVKESKNLGIATYGRPTSRRKKQKTP